MRLVFVGPPGSGKGTQAKLLQERLGYLCIGTGELLRSAVRDGTPSGKLAEPFMLRGQLVPDDVVNARVSEYFHGVNPPQRFLLDGYPRNKSQAEFLDRTLIDCKLKLTKVILFAVPDDELIRRLESRGGKENRPDDNLETIRMRLHLYHQTTEAVVDHYRSAGLLAEIPATGDVEAIYAKVVELIA